MLRTALLMKEDTSVCQFTSDSFTAASLWTHYCVAMIYLQIQLANSINVTELALL